MNTRFKRRPNVPILSRKQQVRQGRAVNAAQAAFATTDELRLFLNSHHDELGARPIDMAIDSDDGLAAVEQHLSARADS